MSFKLISDSSCDITELSGVDFESVPLKIITAEKEFTDDKDLDVHGMVDYLAKYKGRSSSSCPNTDDWKNAFGDADELFCVTITSGLSGSYNSARISSDDHVEAKEGRKAFVVDSLSTGPEMALILEKLRDLFLEKLNFEQIKEKIIEYKKRTHLIFALESMHNLANNGRVNPMVAKLAGVLGIRVVGKASNEGTLEITNKVRGLQKTISTIIENMKASGFCEGKVRIHHCENEGMLESLKQAIKNVFPLAQIAEHTTGALCSFYAERGGVLIGFEGACK